MATTKDFLAALDKKIAALQALLRPLTVQSKTADKRQCDLLAERTRQLDRLATTLLPNLDEATVRALGRKLPKFLSPERVTHLRTTALQEMVTNTDEWEQAAAKRLKRLDEVPGLQQLMRDGYGTPAYATNFLHRKYYRDWKRADEIANQFCMKSLNDIREYYRSLEGYLAERSDAAALAKAALANRVTITVDPTILAQLTVQLKATLDTLDATPGWMRKIATLDKQIREHTQTLTKLQTKRNAIEAALAKLIALRERATRSSVREVPKRYIAQLSRDTDDGSDLVVIAMMSDHFPDSSSSTSHADHFAGHGGEFGGGGASGSYAVASSAGGSHSGSPS
jgi:hypothetical protein